MENTKQGQHLVAIIGAGPAGLYATRALAAAGVHVVLLNRDIKPGGLAEYGIYPDKYKMKEGLRNQFRQILASPQVDYYGNVRVGNRGDIPLDNLRQMGFQAILTTVGAQGTKWLGLPGENLCGVYHAKDLVYHYNKLPPFSEQPFEIGWRVAVIGAGNVMMDMAHWLVRERKVSEMIAVVRRGPAEVKFDKREFEGVAANVDLAALDAELARVTPTMQAIGQDPAQARAEILAGLPRALPRVSDTRLRFEFLASPVRMIGNEAGQVAGLEVEDNTLRRANDDTKARGLGTFRVLDVDTVIFAIGDRVEEQFGLPLKGNEFAKNPTPSFPVEGISYEAFDPEKQSPVPGVFLAGWARVASTGLVGVARKDGERGAKAVLQYLQTLPPADPAALTRLPDYMAGLNRPIVTKADVQRLEEIEREEAKQCGVEEYKFASNEEMLARCRGVRV
ncbi:MAG: FAD-dependent oxidoreductase [Anaerolineae bacterium]